MAKVTHYMAHDPVANIEGIVTDFDKETIAAASDSGIIFIAVDENGAREVVDAADVAEPKFEDESYVFVQPQYVDDRTAAAVACFDALAAIVDPAAEQVCAEGCDVAENINPVDVFLTALAEMKKLVSEGDDNQ